MFYDYLINDGGWNIFKLVLCVLGVIPVILAIISFTRFTDNYISDTDKIVYKKQIILYSAIFFTWYSVWWLLPSREFIVYHNGDPRIELYKQVAEQQAVQREERKKSFLECLDKGQKQPHTTTFNDTNEVVQTCFDISGSL